MNIADIAIINLDCEVLEIDGYDGPLTFGLASLPQKLDPLLSSAPTEELHSVGDEDEKRVRRIRYGQHPLPAQMDGFSEDLVSYIFSGLGTVSQFYGPLIEQAHDARCEESQSFREVAFMLLSFISCCSKHVKFASVEELDWSDTTMECISELSKIAYGTLEGDGNQQPRELVPTFLSGYHEGERPSGSAPSTNSYWMGSIFVYLTREKLSGPKLETTIHKAAIKGQDETDRSKFELLLFSVQEFVLANVTPEVVCPSECYKLWTNVGTEEVSSPTSPVDHDDEPKIRRWFALKPQDNFKALSRFFLLHNNSPNDLREFGISRELRIVNQHSNSLPILQTPDEDEVERELLLSEWNYREIKDGPSRRAPKRIKTEDNTVRCIPIIQAIDGKRPPNMLSVLVPWKLCGQSPPAKEAHEEAKPRFWNRRYHKIPRDCLRHELELESFPQSSISHKLENILQEDSWSHAIFYSEGLAMLYAQLLFITIGIGGSSHYVDWQDPTSSNHILQCSPGAHLQLASRKNRVYFIARFQPASEDTNESWEEAELEACNQAKKEYFRLAFRFWINNTKTNAHDFVILVAIGTRFRVLCVDHHPQLPKKNESLLDDTFDIETARVFWYHEPWKHCSKMKDDLSKAWSELRFKYFKARETPYDLKDAHDEPAIKEAMKWAARQAEQRGDEEDGNILMREWELYNNFV
ncbi:hypothetical protein FCOIX_8768 [Fusarium coicis]|nr:hypothetical protein FCOIX_8768 [Fusarium coicis]